MFAVDLRGRLLRLVAILIAGVFLLQAFQEDPEQSVGSIQGTVVDSTTGEGLAGVSLTLVESTAMIRQAATSDDDGGFTFEGLPKGSYLLLAEQNGYARQMYGARPGSTSGTSLFLSAGENAEDVLLRLAPAGVISGRVVGEDGEPLPLNSTAAMAFRPVHRRGVRDWDLIQTAMVNDLGEFRLSNLPPGDYVVAANYTRSLINMGASAQQPGETPEREYTLTFFSNVTDAAQAVPVPVTPGAEYSGVRIQLVKTETVRIRGKVDAPEGTKMVMVRLTPKGVTSTTLALLRGKIAVANQSNGSFELTGVVPGSYMLSAAAPLDLEDQLVASTLLEVGDESIDGIALETVAGLELVGSAVASGDEAVKVEGVGIALEAVEYVGVSSPSATADEDGAFTLKNIQPNRYYVRLISLPEGSFVESLHYGEREIQDDMIDLTAGVAGTLEIVLNPSAAQVDGVVQDEEANPVNGATVVLVPDSRRYSQLVEATSKEDGSYELTGIPPGDYKLYAWTDIEAGAYQDPEALKRFAADAEELSLEERGHSTMTLKAIPFD